MCDKILACVKSVQNKDDDDKKVVARCRDLSKEIGVVKFDGAAADKWNKAVRLMFSMILILTPILDLWKC